MMSPAAIAVRRYRRSDRAAVREICGLTAWAGEPSPERVPDEWIWAEFWTRYYTDCEPHHTWVATAPTGAIYGYLTGTVDACRAERFIPRIIPGVVWRILRLRLLRQAQARRALFGLAESLLRGDLRLPPGIVRRHPATLHLDLLPAARGGGGGRRLLSAFLDDLRAAGIPGAHVQILSVNPTAARFFADAGFRRVATRPFRALAHLDGGSVAIETWIKPL